MVRCSPKHAGGIHQITVAANRHGNDALVAVRQSGTHSRRSRVADARTAGTAEEIVVLCSRPKASIPLHPRHRHTPLLILYGVPQSGRNPRCTHRGHVPAIGGSLAYSFLHSTVIGPKFISPLF